VRHIAPKIEIEGHAASIVGDRELSHILICTNTQVALPSSPSFLARDERFVMTAILMVGDDPLLLETRAYLLRDWKVFTTTSHRAIEVIRSTAHDLIIFCQTISDETAHTLIHYARGMNPNVATLAIHLPGQPRRLDVELYETQLHDPGRFQNVVARLLPSLR
jgi:hypothetical protein